MSAVKALLVGLFCCLALAAPAAAAYEESPTDAFRDPTWVVPLDGPLGSPFGPRWGRMHRGIDIEGWAETRVKAALPGVVTRVGWLDRHAGLGLVVKIRHADGIGTLYAHLASARVQAGQRVRPGELIGRAGCTGSCTGVHLHFEVRKGGRLVDPLRYLGRELRRR
ncbi:MAG TPA: M23 family metallopeptidase [Gaiellaceae bacterium]|nr:M23 family metallopeptidase [Gaiellaceae bacterium]